jgi:hypothetical protein
MERVFEHGHVRLAIETLNLTEYDTTTQKVTGPRDVEREAELRELEEQINDPARYTGVHYQLAEDCLHAALLARGLERPRVEVDGRFARAERIATEVGHHQQRLRIAYDKAWSAFWWYDDFNELNRLYDQVKELATGSAQAMDLELLTNLWQLLRATVHRGELDETSTRFARRTRKLKTELERLAADRHRSNNALHARTIRLLISLSEALGDTDRLNPVLADLKDVLTASEGLGTYPIKSLVQSHATFCAMGSSSSQS